MNASLPEFWQQASPCLKISLLEGSVGRQHCLSMASSTFALVKNPADQKSELNTARQILISAWEQDPLNGEIATNVLQICQGMLPPTFQKILHTVAENWHPTNKTNVQAILQKGDYEQSLNYLYKNRNSSPDNLFWAEQLWDLCFYENKLDELTEVLALLDGSLTPLKYYLQACIELAVFSNAQKTKNTQGCKNHLNAAIENLKLAEADLHTQHPAHPFEWLAPTELLAHCFCLQGQTQKAIQIWKQILSVRPWHTSLIQRLYSTVFHKALATPPTDAKTALLLYSYNKVKDLDAAISAFAPSAKYFSNISVLDNGSNDGTGEMLTAWQERLGKGLLNVISLPVNVGAPAARNWLRDTDAVKNSDLLIYLDDDALAYFYDYSSSSLTDDSVATRAWLCHLNTAMSIYPNASAYGLKIIDYNSPYLAQSVDLHLRAAGQRSPQEALQLAHAIALPEQEETQIQSGTLGIPAFSLTKVHDKNLSLTNLGQDSPDFGGFSYIKPCVSVTGCCHMFRSRDLLEHGGFNLSFSPSQYDDLERDLRQAANGRYACYNGQTGVYHLQRTGRGRKMSSAAYGSGLANHYKLNAHFDPDKLLKVLRFQFKLLENDLKQKIQALNDAWADL